MVEKGVQDKALEIIQAKKRGNRMMSIPDLQFSSQMRDELKAIKEQNIAFKPLRSKSLIRNVMDIETEESIVSKHSQAPAEIDE